MKDDIPSENLYWMLLRISFRSKHALMRLAEKYQLTIVQLYTLGVMNPGEHIPMNAISCILLCDASNVTGIIDRLLQQGYIIREESPEDRRVKMITLTLKGETLRRKLFLDMPEFELPEYQRLSERQRVQLKKLLSIILQPA